MENFTTVLIADSSEEFCSTLTGALHRAGGFQVLGSAHDGEQAIRLVTEKNPVLSIYNVRENEKVLSIPLKDYALLVKGHYNRAMSDQEYLDRQDEYNLTFFLDEHGQWATSRIIINS